MSLPGPQRVQEFLITQGDESFSIFNEGTAFYNSLSFFVSLLFPAWQSEEGEVLNSWLSVRPFASNNSKSFCQKFTQKISPLQRMWLDSIAKRPTLDYPFFVCIRLLGPCPSRGALVRGVGWLSQGIIPWNWFRFNIRHLLYLLFTCKNNYLCAKNLPTTMGHRYRFSRSDSLIQQPI